MQTEFKTHPKTKKVSAEPSQQCDLHQQRDLYQKGKGIAPKGKALHRQTQFQSVKLKREVVELTEPPLIEI